MKYANQLILLTLLLIAFILRDSIHFSTNLLSLFASKESIKTINIAGQLGYSKEMLIAVKGFDLRAKYKIIKIAKELRQNPYIERVDTNTLPSEKLQSYYKKYFPILADFNNSTLSASIIKNRLQTIYKNQLENSLYTPVDKYDPLELFKLNIQDNKGNTKGGMLSLGNYGYMIRATTKVSPSQLQNAKKLYETVKNILEKYPDTVAFAPFFYTVENSTAIEKDVKKILLISTLVLIIVYYLLIKNIRLLFHALITLSSSIIFATIVCTQIFESFSLLSIAFGTSITTISIDYLLHYYFHGFDRLKKSIDKSVLLGFLTTSTAFFVFSFIPIPIISQISTFALISLSFSYTVFTFVFPHLGFKSYKNNDTCRPLKLKIPASVFLIISIALIIYAFINFRFDGNLRHLDYQNQKLTSIENLFKSNLSNQLKPVIVQGKSIEELLGNLHKLHKQIPDTFSIASFAIDKNSCKEKEEILKNYDFKQLNLLINKKAEETGFKADYFKDAYNFTTNLPSCDVKQIDFDIFKEYHLSIVKNGDYYYTFAMVSDLDKATSNQFVKSIDTKAFFNKTLNTMYKEMIFYSFLAIFIIMVLIALSVRKRFVYAINYILFPLSLTLALLVTTTEINVLHLFSMVILIAIGIDYGIYMTHTQKPSQTIKAVKYSLLSTFAGFGVLIFSSINALHSIGTVITTAMLAIFILIEVMQ